MNRIGVFLSSHESLDPAYTCATEQFGKWLGELGKTLVYGGSNAGLMEVLAKNVRDNGGRVCGVVPDILTKKGMESQQCHITFYCADLNDRKATMERESDCFVALPGGIGTLDEIFTIAAGATIGNHQKKIALFNVEHCWDNLWETLLDLQSKNLIDKKLMSHILKIDTFEQLKDFIEEK